MLILQTLASKNQYHKARCRANIWNAILAVGGACESTHGWPGSEVLLSLLPKWIIPNAVAIFSKKSCNGLIPQAFQPLFN
jgi:hypothetical protein